MIRARLIRSNSLALAGVLALLGLGLYVAVRGRIYGAVDDELRRRASFRPGPPDGRRGPDGPPPFRGGPPPRLADASGLDPDQRERVEFELSLLFPRGFRADGTPDGPPDRRREPLDRAALLGAPGERLTTVTIEDRRVRVVTRRVRERGAFRLIQMGAPLAPADAQAADFGRTLLFALPLALAVATVAGAALTRRALRPVREIARAADRIAPSDLSARLPTTGDDEFGELAAAFNRTFDRLEEAFARQRRFVGDASHELKSPLTAIKTRLGVARRVEGLDPRVRRHLDAMEGSADAMAALVRDLLLLAASDEGALALRRAPTPLAVIAERALAGLSDEERETVEVEVTGAADVDPDLFGRALGNLVRNAVRHTDAPHRTWIRSEPGALIVEDDGGGIPEGSHEAVFERFHRLDASRDRETGGTGLGLSIVRSLARAHGGDATLSPREGGGTVARLSWASLPGPQGAGGSAPRSTTVGPRSGATRPD